MKFPIEHTIHDDQIDGDHWTGEVVVRFKRKSLRHEGEIIISSKVLTYETLDPAWTGPDVLEGQRESWVGSMLEVEPVCGNLRRDTGLPYRGTYYSARLRSEEVVEPTLRERAPEILAKVTEVIEKIDAKVTKEKGGAIPLKKRIEIAKDFAARAEAFYGPELCGPLHNDANDGDTRVKIRVWTKGEDVVRIYFNWWRYHRDGHGYGNWSPSHKDTGPMWDDRPKMLYVNAQGKICGKRFKVLPKAIEKWEADKKRGS